MKAVLFAIAPVALSLAVVSSGLAASSSPATVATASSGLGRIVVDGRGRTLYLFEKDTRGHSACSGACAAYWPPFLANGKSTANSYVTRCGKSYSATAFFEPPL